ncbi:OstA family protein [Erythrobacter insulae]|uniref:OstA family protein n=2 Tax=Erythrobacter insulae TaxID=2584124 RepID=A0A547PF11_9SPHN|nr:LptA/OstA family protein [Erythrobacter insulae]TRD12717.1 OstA family protein [Erythrobacter insulae]
MAGGFAMTLAVTGGIGLQAQGIAAHNTNAPVNYNAGSIELQDRQNRVALSGGVTVTQAGLTVRSNRMLVNFTDIGSLNIQRITATGGVVVTRGNERASGDVAIYDFSRRIITLAGNVSLRRGTDTLNGGRLVIDLRSGVSSVDGSPSGRSGSVGETGSDGRVTGTFSVPQSDEND